MAAGVRDMQAELWVSWSQKCGAAGGPGIAQGGQSESLECQGTRRSCRGEHRRHALQFSAQVT